MDAAHGDVHQKPCGDLRGLRWPCGCQTAETDSNMVVRFGLNNKNAKGRQEALAKAQKKLTLEGHPGRNVGDLHRVLVKPNDIGEIPEIFQPREFTLGARDHDRIHVTALTQEIRNRGELDPPLVIKLKRDGWTVVEGHHRVEAYKELGRGDQEIQCDWFYGSVQEAAIEALERNNILKLNIKQPDRMEEAWKWVLLRWGSKAEIIKACGVSDGTVGTMRRAVRFVQLLDEKNKPMRPEHKDFNDAVAFRKRLQEWKRDATVPKEDSTPSEWFDYLMTFTWGVAGRMLKGVTQQEFDEENAAMRIVKRLNGAVGHMLSENPKITARALQILDPTLPPQLIKAWRKDPDVEWSDPYDEDHVAELGTQADPIDL
jgi:ParB-like nuclease domain